MRYLNSNLLILFFSIFLFSCYTKKNDKKNIESPIFTTFLERTTGSAAITKKAYLIIPIEQGCESCINKTISFAKDNISQGKLGVVLSSSNSKDINKIMITDLSDFKKEQFICDTKDYAKTLGVSAFPVIFYCDDLSSIVPISLNAENIEVELGKLLSNIQ